MNDFSELEADLKKLRPRAASSQLTVRVERALAGDPDVSGRIATAGVLPKKRSFRINWLGLGLGLAAATSFLILAKVNTDQTAPKPKLVAMTPMPLTAPLPVADTFLPAGVTQVVYSRRDEGLQFPEGADEPVRRVRSEKRETLKWHNPKTGTSLRISYPSEEVTLTPVSGQ
jgi:hypothetical protein